MIQKSIGILLIVVGISWFWYCFKKVDDSSFKQYSIPRDFFTGLFILILGVLILFEIIEM